MTESEAIKHIQSYTEAVDGMIEYCRDFEPKTDISGYLEKKTVFDTAITALKEIQQYREIGTVEECKEMNSIISRVERNELAKIIDEWIQYRKVGTVEECKKAVKEEDTLKFYYCESEDDYYIGKRVGNFYYARYGETGFEWFMSRCVPWGEHIFKPNTLWKEYTYPSEPKEIPFFEWLQGFLKKYCGGTAEKCREAMDKQRPKKAIKQKGLCFEKSRSGEEQHEIILICPLCGGKELKRGYPCKCGQVIQWNENLEDIEDE